MAIKTIKSKKVVKNIGHDAAQESSREYAACMIELSRLEAEMNESINRIKDRYKESVTTLQQTAKEHREVLEVYAQEQRSSWGKKKSFELLHTIISFSKNPPRVAKSKKFTWDAVTELMKKNKVFSRFLRETVEINKEAILQEENEAVLNMLKEDCFITIEQDERFDVDVKKELLNVE